MVVSFLFVCNVKIIYMAKVKGIYIKIKRGAEKKF